MSNKCNYNITIVESDDAMAQSIHGFLIKKGMQTTVIHTGLGAIDHIIQHQPDLVILNTMLPGIDGLEVCRRVRHSFHNPVLMLTEKNDDISEIEALNAGGDNLLKKPVALEVLLANIQALLRCNNRSSAILATFEVQDLTINLQSFTLYRSGVEIQLTSGEFEILTILAQDAGKPVSREKLYQKIRDMEYDGIDRSLDLRISTLRKKLDDAEPPYRYIKTVRAFGYILVI